MTASPFTNHSLQPHGRAFRIMNKDLLTAEVIPEFFVQTKFKSFTRQLSGWGFKRLHRPGADFGCYYHECFLRGLPLLTWLMKRVPSNKGKLSPSPSEEPQFWMMDPLPPTPMATAAFDPRALSISERLELQGIMASSVTAPTMQIAFPPNIHACDWIGSAQNAAISSVQDILRLSSPRSTRSLPTVGSTAVAMNVVSAPLPFSACGESFATSHQATNVQDPPKRASAAATCTAARIPGVSSAPLFHLHAANNEDKTTHRITPPESTYPAEDDVKEDNDEFEQDMMAFMNNFQF